MSGHAELKIQILKELKPIVKEYVEGWLNNQKDTLLLQLIGFIEQDKWVKSHQGLMNPPSTKIDSIHDTPPSASASASASISADTE